MKGLLCFVKNLVVHLMDAFPHVFFAFSHDGPNEVGKSSFDRFLKDCKKHQKRKGIEYYIYLGQRGCECLKFDLVANILDFCFELSQGVVNGPVGIGKNNV
jgi:hypothetical protein